MRDSERERARDRILAQARAVDSRCHFVAPDRPDQKQINIAERCAGKKIILLGLPGAFTPC